jgi:hypothetical protein
VSLPQFNEFGDLPTGVYEASFTEVVARFGRGSAQREAVTARLQQIYQLALTTGALDRLIVFGSYVSDNPAPNDVDVILVMRDDFYPALCPQDARVLLDHSRATSELGASIFWIRPGMLLGESLEQFLAHWQRKRDGSRRGIVEVKA